MMFITMLLGPVGMLSVWKSIVAIPETPPPTILFGVKNTLIAKPVIIVPNIMAKMDLNFFIFVPLKIRT